MYVVVQGQDTWYWTHGPVVIGFVTCLTVLVHRYSTPLQLLRFLVMPDAKTEVLEEMLWSS